MNAQRFKGQVSLEYLMTYGIAIAIVVIAVAALYSMGVFNTNNASTPPCVSCFSDFAESNFNPGAGNMKLELKNGPIELTKVNVTCALGCAATNGTNVIYTIPANGVFIVDINGSATTGANAQFNYTKSGSTLPTIRNQTIGASYFK